MLTHVWFTQTKLSPQGVPSLTRPCSGYSLVKFADPIVALCVFNVENVTKIEIILDCFWGGGTFYHTHEVDNNMVLEMGHIFEIDEFGLDVI